MDGREALYRAVLWERFYAPWLGPVPPRRMLSIGQLIARRRAVLMDMTDELHQAIRKGDEPPWLSKTP